MVAPIGEGFLELFQTDLTSSSIRCNYMWIRVPTFTNLKKGVPGSGGRDGVGRCFGLSVRSDDRQNAISVLGRHLIPFRNDLSKVRIV